jgi:hypothetical protein
MKRYCHSFPAMGKSFWVLAVLGFACFITGCKKQESAPAGSTNSPATSADGVTLVSGRILFKGTPPAPKPVPLDSLCGKLHTVPPTELDYQVGPSGGLGEVLVYLKGLPEAADMTPTSENPMLDQEGCIYKPRVFGVMVNQKFRIRNSDQLMHNVHALPKKNKEFNFAQPVRGQVNERTFTEAEVLVRIKCDVHPWMNAYVGVLPHRFFTVTDEDGQFRLPGIPTGKFTLEAAHPKGGVVSQEIEIAPGEHKQIELSFQAK